MMIGLIAIGFWTPLAQASDGDLDPTFGVGGVFGKPENGIPSTQPYYNSLDSPGDVAIQSDDKIVVVTSKTNNIGSHGEPLGGPYAFLIQRYTADGFIDSSFGNNGDVIFNFAIFRDDMAHAVAIQPDGKIVVVGETKSFLFGSGTLKKDFALIRLNPNGGLDSSFGNNGRVQVDFASGDDIAYDVAIQPNGKIVAVGEAEIQGNKQFGVVRLNPNGTLDSSFAGDGKATVDWGDKATGVALQSSGQILVVGYSNNGHSKLAQFNVNGTLDISFGLAGIWSTPITYANSVVIQPDGKFIVAGNGVTKPNVLGLARHYWYGSTDYSFGVNGVVNDYDNGNAFIHPRVAVHNNKILVVGTSALVATFSGLTFYRYQSNGVLDPSFGVNGKVFYGFSSIGNIPLSSLYGFGLQSDGKIVVAGFNPNEQGYPGGTGGVFLARLSN